MKKISAIFIFVYFFSFIAQANDATAIYGVGGIELTKSDHIQMKKEDLYLSADQVRVSYEFFNSSKTDIETVVAFPLPRLNVAEFMHSDTILDRKNPLNYIQFKLKINDQDQKYSIEEKALVGEKDVTAILKQNGISISPLTTNIEGQLNTLTKEQKSNLIAQGILDKGGYIPRWHYSLIFHWKQNFPANQITKVFHEYKPIYGLTFYFKSALTQLREPYCVDDGTERALDRLERNTKNRALELKEVHYILQTAKTWKGPIEDFTVTFDKGNANNIISLCVDGIKKINATQFKVRKTNFVPTKDIKFMIVGAINPL